MGKNTYLARTQNLFHTYGINTANHLAYKNGGSVTLFIYCIQFLSNFKVALFSMIGSRGNTSDGSVAEILDFGSSNDC